MTRQNRWSDDTLFLTFPLHHFQELKYRRFIWKTMMMMSTCVENVTSFFTMSRNTWNTKLSMTTTR